MLRPHSKRNRRKDWKNLQWIWRQPCMCFFLRALACVELLVPRLKQRTFQWVVTPCPTAKLSCSSFYFGCSYRWNRLAERRSYFKISNWKRNCLNQSLNDCTCSWPKVTATITFLIWFTWLFVIYTSNQWLLEARKTMFIVVSNGSIRNS